MLILSTFLLYKSGFDTAILLVIQDIHSPLLDRIMLSITSLGDPIVLLAVCLGLGFEAICYRRSSEQQPWG